MAKKWAKLSVTLAAAAVLGTSLFAPVATQAATYPKFVFMYTGLKDTSGDVYVPYTTSDINNLSNESAIILTGTDNWAIYGTGGASNNYDNYVNYLVGTINTIKSSSNPNIPIYIGLPGMDQNTFAYSESSVYSWMANFMSDLKTKLGSNWSQVSGFYFNLERMYANSSDGAFNFSSLYSNPSVQLANDVSYTVHSTYGKQFIWVPYITPGTSSYAADQIKRNGYVANTTNIFDYVMQQPGYYLSSTGDSSGLDATVYGLENNAVCYEDGTIVTPRTGNATARIGGEIEMDGNIYNTSSVYYTRYNYEVSYYQNFKNDGPMAYYLYYSDSYPSTTKPEMAQSIASFFNY